MKHDEKFYSGGFLSGGFVLGVFVGGYMSGGGCPRIWRNLAEHVRNWVRRCHQCIRFKSTQSAHGLMHVRVYQHPFQTLGVDYVGELSQSLHENKWILTVVCSYSILIC